MDRSLSLAKAGVDRVAARHTAASWLSALANEDIEGLAGLSAPNLRVVGFSLPNGPEWSGCGESKNGLSERTMHATAGSTVSEVVSCLVKDLILVDSIPRVPADEWTEETSRPDARGRVGYLKPLDLSADHPAPGALHPRLEKYRPVIAEGVDGAALTFFASDGSGSFAYGVLVVRESNGRTLVSTVLLDEEFNC